jgi:hypothetical protein
MQGYGKHIVNNETRLIEFMSIESNPNGELAMYIMLGAPSKGNKQPKAFKLTSLSENKATFENPANDFPSTYYRINDKQMNCSIEGAENNKPRIEHFNFKLQ